MLHFCIRTRIRVAWCAFVHVRGAVCDHLSIASSQVAEQRRERSSCAVVVCEVLSVHREALPQLLHRGVVFAVGTACNLSCVVAKHVIASVHEITSVELGCTIGFAAQSCTSVLPVSLLSLSVVLQSSVRGCAASAILPACAVAVGPAIADTSAVRRFSAIEPILEKLLLLLDR